jgi:hypothetical protein
LSDFDVNLEKGKKKNFAKFGHKRIFAQERVKKRTRVYVKKGCLARPAAELGKFHHPLSFSVLRIGSDFDPGPGVGGTR